jgi:uncharacterized protein with NRDE domain
MCLLALIFRGVDDAAVVVGANREEFYRRGGEPPRVLAGPVPAVAGIDPVASGTWLGLNAAGVVVAVTNRPRSEVPDRPRSRGLLTREVLLNASSAAAAAEHAIRELDHGPYAGCNFVCADNDNAIVIQSGDWLRVRPLPPGLHALTNGDVNDGTDPRVVHTLDWMGQHAFAQAEDCMQALRQLCGQHEPEYAPMCFRLAERGTVSSTVLAVRATLTDGSYFHAQGPPDRTPYTDYSYLLRELEPSGDERRRAEGIN